MQLADTLWPRTGGGPANRARIAVEGPRDGKVAWTCTLPAHGIKDAARFCGLALGEDGALRVVSGGRLYAVSPSGTILWRDTEPCFAPPVCLRGGATLASCRGRFRLLDAFGQPGEEIAYASAPDDSNVAPNLSGEILLSTGPAGDLHRYEDGRFVHVGWFGYDTLPPAVFDDGTLAVGGYGGVGYCRVALDGSFLWRTDLEADLLPVIASDQRSAVGSLPATRGSRASTATASRCSR